MRPTGELWRLIEDGPAPGEWNMAVDTALLELAGDGAAGPTLRFYGWDRPTLSIGHLQKVERSIDLDYVKRNGIPVVRRPTGGRGLVHDDEVTYCVTIPSSSRFYGSLRETYGMVADAIRKALGDIGIETHSTGDQAGLKGSALCHAAKTRFEISFEGRKIVCGAQRRLKSASMQHGSIALRVNKRRDLSCFVWRDETDRKKAASKMGGLGDCLEKTVGQKEARQALIRSFEKLYGIEFEKGKLTYIERETAGSLAGGMAVVYKG